MVASERGNGVIVSGVLNDIHSLGLYVLEQAFSHLGYRVVRLGTMASQEDFIAAARETAADALLISNSNGHAEVEFEGLGDRCHEAGLGQLYIYAGGMLTVVAGDWHRVAGKLESYGVRRVFEPGGEVNEIITAIHEDLTGRRREAPGGSEPRGT